MGFDDFDIKPGNFDNQNMWLSFIVYGLYYNESCKVEMFAVGKFPTKGKTDYDIKDYSYYNVFISRYDGTFLSKLDLETLCCIVYPQIPTASVSLVEDPHIYQLDEELTCAILTRLQCQRKLKGFTIIKNTQAETGPCAKCGCIDKYNSPSPHFNNEIRCYQHWA